MGKTFSEQYPELAQMSEKINDDKKKSVSKKPLNSNELNTNKMLETYKMYGSTTRMAEFRI